MDRHSVNRFLNTHKTIKNKEKGSHGEVFTPLSVIDTMLASLPKSVWSESSLMWLDPACGIGQFPLKIIRGGAGYPGLYDGLAKSIPNESERMKHILHHLHCYDLNPKNVAMLRKEFEELCPGATEVHVKTADFLDTTLGRKFDIIVGNPPYNTGGTKRVGKKRVHVEFVEKALDSLEPKGYLLFVCPPNYRQAGTTMNHLFAGRHGHFQHIRIFGPDETHRLFKVQARVDSFLWQESVRGKTHIIDEYGQSYVGALDLDHHVPNFAHTLFDKLRRIPLLENTASRSTSATTIGCKGFSKDGTFPTIHLIIQDGIKVLGRNKAHPCQHRQKLILNGLGIPYVLYDAEGKYGVTQTPVVILEPSKGLVEFMESKLFQLMVWALRLTGNNNLPYVCDMIPADFGASLKLSAVEKELIESFEIPVYANRELNVECAGNRRKTLKVRR